jgi:hypothetical protein
MLEHREKEEDEAGIARTRMRINAVIFFVFACAALFLPSPWGKLAFAFLLIVAGAFLWLHIWGSDEACMDVRRAINQIMLMSPD